MKILSSSSNSNSFTLRRSPSSLGNNNNNKLKKKQKGDDGSVATINSSSWRSSFWGKLGRRHCHADDDDDDDDSSVSSAVTVVRSNFGKVERRLSSSSRDSLTLSTTSTDDVSSNASSSSSSSCSAFSLSSSSLSHEPPPPRVSFLPHLVEQAHETEDRSFWEIMDTWYTDDDIENFKRQVEQQATRLLSSAHDDDPRMQALRQVVHGLQKVVHHNHDHDMANSSSPTSPNSIGIIIILDADILGLERVVLPQINRRSVVQQGHYNNRNQPEAMRLVATECSRLYRRFAHCCGVANALEEREESS